MTVSAKILDLVNSGSIDAAITEYERTHDGHTADQYRPWLCDLQGCRACMACIVAAIHALKGTEP